ncbi:MAG: hypothetical protein ACTHQQ_00465, partial [Solirubrobacteraceae bacterium]
VPSALAAAAPTAADTKPPTSPYIQAIFPLGGCKVAMRIGLSTDNSTPQNEIRYQVLSNGFPISGQLLLADTRITPPGFGYIDPVVQPAPTAQRFTIEAVDQAGNHSQPSFAVSRLIPGPC